MDHARGSEQAVDVGGLAGNRLHSVYSDDEITLFGVVQKPSILANVSVGSRSELHSSILRQGYRIMMVLCGTLVVFCPRASSESFSWEPEELRPLMKAKSRIRLQRVQEGSHT